MRVNDDYLHCNAAQQVPNPNSVFSYWQRILHLRKQFLDVFVYGKFEMIDRDHPSVLCYKRVGKTKTATIVANFTDNHESWVAPPDIQAALGVATFLLANYEQPSAASGGVISLKPFETFVAIC